jgi:hypothetical protein
MLNKRLDEIEKSDINVLIANGVRESRQLDYKEILPGATDEDKREFLSDVSSFANAAGGFILYGVKEQRDATNKATGIPESASGLSGVNLDAESLRLQNLLRDSVDPRIPTVQFKAIEGFTDGPMLAVRIARSWASPHMVTLKNLSRFYSRNSNGKFQMDTREIRAAFTLSESVPERVRRFRDDRLSRIIADETPIAIPSKSKLVLHLVPVSAVEPGSQVNLRRDRLEWLKAPSLPQIMGAHEYRGRFNLDGFLMYNQVYEPNTPPACGSYAQLFRNGSIEAVHVLDHPMGDLISQTFEPIFAQAFDYYIHQMKVLGLGPPIFVLISLLGVKGYHLWVHNDEFSRRFPAEGENLPFDRDTMLLPDILIEEYGAKGVDVLRPAFDALWQAGGWSRCYRYDDEGKWIGRL